MEETRSLKPVRIPINLLTVVLLFLKGLERFPGRVFIYLRFEGKMSISFFTSAEREVKDSRRSGMYQSCNFLTRLGKQSL